LLVGAIAFEIPSGKYGARVATALIASLLFLTYPLHVESVAWVIGRVDVNCTFFYLSSIYCYFRFRRQGSRMFLAAAIVLQLLALMSKEMAITLPCVLVLSELFLARCMDWKEATVRNRLFYLLGFLVMLAAFAVWRTLAIGVLVGGYGAGGLSALRQGLYNFCDVSTLQKIIYGVNEHRSLPEIFSTMAFSAWLVLLASLTIKGLIDAKTRWLLLFFAGWTVVANLPTFQIWHIFPNLVGSRLFFLGSAPLCILLALAAVSLVERPRKPMAILLAIVAFGAGLILSGTWAVALGHNLQSWQSAGKQTSDTRTFLVDLAGKSSEEQKILLVDLPQDFEGAGLIGRAEFLATLLSPPLSSHDLSGRVATTESPIPGQRDFIASEKLQLKARSKDVGPVLKWSDEKGKYIDWKIESVSKKTGEKSVSDTISSVTHKDFPIHFSGVEVDQFQWFAAEVD
ncbi:MAG: hypothetical protein K8F91_06360, partial [Candidatus Obscuribacterales bacterium]|nr:hypothetical protein [Candidatus Obscuribacterales bacterium]